MMKRVLIGALCLAVAVGIGVYLSRGVLQAYRDQRVRTDQSVAEMRQSEAERARLTRQKMALETDAGQEALVRSKGFVKNGEVPLELNR